MLLPRKGGYMVTKNYVAVLTACLWVVGGVPRPAHAQSTVFRASASLCLSHVGSCQYEELTAPGAARYHQKGQWSLPNSNANGAESGHTQLLADYGAVSLDNQVSTRGAAVGVGGFSIDGDASSRAEYEDAITVGSTVLEWGSPISIKLDTLISHVVRGAQVVTGDGNISAEADRYLSGMVEVASSSGTLVREVFCTDRISHGSYPCTIKLGKTGEQTFSNLVDTYVGEELVIHAWFQDDVHAAASCSVYDAGDNCSARAHASVNGLSGPATQTIRMTPQVAGVTLVGASGHDWTSGSAR